MPEPVPLPTRTGIAESIEDYLADCRARGLRSSTIAKSYGWPLTARFLPWCREQGISRVEQVTQKVVNRYLVWLHDRPNLSPASIDAYGIAVGRWLRWAQRDGQLTGATPAVSRVRLPRAVREIVTEDEKERMLRAADNDRDRLIVQLLWDTGIRASELLALRTGDLVRFDGRWFLRVLAPWRGGGAKGSHERLVPLPRPRDLRRYLEGPRAKLDADTDHIFLSRLRDGRGVHRPLLITGLEQMIQGLAREARVEHRVYPHLFRHSAITRWRRQHLDPLWIMAITGHTSLAMIERHYDQTDHRDAYDALARVLAPKESR